MTVSVVPVSVAVGATQHITPVDQNGAALPVAQCAYSSPNGIAGGAVPTGTVTVTTDDTGFIFTGVAPGGGYAEITYTTGTLVLVSAGFHVVVTSPTTAVGTTSP